MALDHATDHAPKTGQNREIGTFVHLHSRVRLQIRSVWCGDAGGVAEGTACSSRTQAASARFQWLSGRPPTALAPKDDELLHTANRLLR